MGILSRDITSDDISIEENSSRPKKKKNLQFQHHQATHVEEKRTVGSEKKIRKNVAFPEVTNIQLFIPK